MSIGMNLKKLRNSRNISGAQVARDMEISHQRYSLYETDKREMDISMLVAFANYYHVTVNDLLQDDIDVNQSISDSEAPKQKTKQERDDEIVLEMFNNLNARHRFEILKLMERYAEDEKSDAKENQLKHIG